MEREGARSAEVLTSSLSGALTNEEREGEAGLPGMSVTGIVDRLDRWAWVRMERWGGGGGGREELNHGVIKDRLLEK